MGPVPICWLSLGSLLIQVETYIYIYSSPFLEGIHSYGYMVCLIIRGP